MREGKFGAVSYELYFLNKEGVAKLASEGQNDSKIVGSTPYKAVTWGVSSPYKAVIWGATSMSPVIQGSA